MFKKYTMLAALVIASFSATSISLAKFGVPCDYKIVPKDCPNFYFTCTNGELGCAGTEVSPKPATPPQYDDWQSGSTYSNATRGAAVSCPALYYCNDSGAGCVADTTIDPHQDGSIQYKWTGWC